MLDSLPKTKQLKHLIDIASLSEADIMNIVDLASLMQKDKYIPSLKDKTVVLLFAENSTRTKLSFEVAAQNLEMKILRFDANTSSLAKGESLKATVDNLYQIGADAIVLRHSVSGILNNLISQIDYPVSFLNAGDGNRAHPTQALLDFYTMVKHHKTVKNKKITIIGDISHSRVARSNIELLTKFGADVHVCAPSYFKPYDIEKYGITYHKELIPAIKDAEVVMCLRVQTERHEKSLYPRLSEYINSYRLDSAKVQKYCGKNVIIMHPGPANCGVEVSEELLNGEYGKTILEQVKNGVYIRMAVLHILLGSTK